MIAIRVVWILAWIGLGTVTQGVRAAEGAIGFRAGAAAVDVTPRAYPARIVGGFLEGTATKTLDPLFARSLVLDDGRVRLAIVVVDTCVLPREIIDPAKAMASRATGIPVDRMLVAATHTHSAPTVVSLLGTDQDEDYPRHLPGWIAQAIEQASRNLAPARIGWAQVEAPEYVHCRRWIRRPDRIGEDPFGHKTVRAMMHPGYDNPDYIGPSGSSDPDLSIVSVQSLDGRPVAVLANFGMHYVGAEPVSADYFGAFARKIADRLGAGKDSPAFVGMLSNGTSGDQWYMDYAKPRKVHTCDSMAEALSTLAADACRRMTYRNDVSLACEERTLLLRVRPIADDELARARAAFAGVNERKPREFKEVYPREQVLLSRMPATRELKLQALRIGELAIAAIPCEVFAITGLKIKACSPLERTFIIELANGYDGYIAPPEQHRLGGYTTWRARSSCLEVEAEPKITAVVLDLLEGVSGKPRRAMTDQDCPFGQRPAVILASKPSAYWRLNELEGSRARDASGNGRDAEFVGTVAYGLDGPVSPDGVSGSRFVNRAPYLAGGHIRAKLPTIGREYTVEMWFYSGMPADARTRPSCLFARSGHAAGAHAGDCLRIGGAGPTAGRLVFHGLGEPAPVLTGATCVAPRTWHHLVLTRDGRTVTARLDGAANPDLVGDAGAGSPLGDVFFFGYGGDEESAFEGKLDEVAVYDRALPLRAPIDGTRSDR